MNYTLSEPDVVSHIGEGDFSLSGDFKIVKENATSVNTEFITVSGAGRYESQTYDKGSGITTYNADKDNVSNAYLMIGNMSWSNMKYVLKTFDNGTGAFSLYAEF